MNRFKEMLDELRQRPAAKQAEQALPVLPKMPEPAAPTTLDETNGSFKLPYSSDPEPLVEPWH